MFIEYSPWWLIPLVLIAVLGSFVLYFYPKRKFFSKTQSVLLSSIRFLALLLSLFLIVSPFIKQKKTVIKKPLIILAQDNSSSILMTKYSPFYKNEYLKGLEKLSESLEKDFEVKTVLFGNDVREINNNEIKSIKWEDYATDISSVIEKIEEKYINLNLSGIVLITDGIINQGMNPLSIVENLQIPIFTVAMGDTTINKDLSIGSVRNNRFAYLNNKFPIEITALAKKAKGSRSIIRITKDGRTLFEERFDVDNDTFYKNFETSFLADKVGLQRYKISLETTENGKTVISDTKDIFIEVLDGRQKVLLVGNSPHPDLSAIKQSIEENENYEVKSFLFNELPASFSEYNIAVLHQIPSSNPQHLKAIQKLKDENIPILFIIGSQTNMPYLNSLSIGLNITGNKTTQNSATSIFNNNFTLFSVSKETENLLNRFPPLQPPFGRYQVSPLTQSLAFQNIGIVQTDYPLIAFTNDNSTRYGIIVGEGIWRWRLQNYLINQTHDQVNEIIHKSVQYLATKIDKSRFRVICDKVFAENQPIVLDAELYNESYELVNEPEVKITITNQDKKKYPYVFSRTSNSYLLNLGAFPAGEYNYITTTNYGGKALQVQGVFYVSSQNLEQIDLVANHNLLFNISERTSAEMIYPNDIERLKDLIEKRDDIKPIVNQTITNKRLIDMWWDLFLIISLFAAEWFLRKFWGKV
ncbi:MAG TPA: VWA domain-containing protein [Bacteroidales bacterium]|nr:VWA domain-containing protein [Bacteroidales bacterium]